MSSQKDNSFQQTRKGGKKRQQEVHDVLQTFRISSKGTYPCLPIPPLYKGHFQGMRVEACRRYMYMSLNRHFGNPQQWLDLIFPPHPCKKDMERRKKLSAGGTYHFTDILDILTSDLTRVFPPHPSKKGIPRTERILGSYHTHIEGISPTVTSVCPSPPPTPSSTWNVCFLSSPPLHTLSCIPKRFT